MLGIPVIDDSVVFIVDWPELIVVTEFSMFGDTVADEELEIIGKVEVVAEVVVVGESSVVNVMFISVLETYSKEVVCRGTVVVDGET